MLNGIDLSRADLNLLVLFEAVFTERHVGRAAERLNLSASAVSHGIGRLRRLLNDPLFLKTPKGVMPSDRALALAPAIAEVLQQVRAVIARAEPFDPATSNRRMVIGAPDAVSAVFLQPLLADLAIGAPNINIGIRQLLPAPSETMPNRAWRTAFVELETSLLDIAIIPADECPARFERQFLYEEDFVLAMRRGHPFGRAPSLDAYCRSGHLVVSQTGDPHGFVDDVLAARGLARRVALTVPNFMFACAMLKDCDLLCAIPRRFAGLFAERLDLKEPPLPLGEFRINAFTSKAALADGGIAWLLDRLIHVMRM